LDTHRISGLTLIELLIAISIATILTGVVVLMLKTSLDSYSFGQQEVLLEKALDDCLDEIAGGGFENNGIKDSLEILNVQPTFITFVPLWVDDSHTLKPEHENTELVTKTPFTLNRPFKAGASLPIAEVSTTDDPRRKTQDWKLTPITFLLGPHKEPLKPDDQVFLNEPVEPGSKIRFIFQPDATNFPDCAMTIKWQQDKIIRTYKGKTDTIPKYNIPGVTLTGFNLQYFDNTNTEVEPRPELIPNITALKVSLKVSLGTKAKHETRTTKNGFIFINIRNSRTAGAGLIIRQGTRIKIPDSKHIRVFSLANVIGIKEGGTIELEARPKKGTTWKICIELGFDDKTPILKRYSVEYPPGRTVYSETINLTTDLPLNFMNLGGSGRYDYDFDKDGNNVVNLEGDVELVVTKMDADGAALFIRP
jgi:type II secretory pathway pseudopilin PulG